MNKILVYPNKILKKIATEVKDIDKKLLEQIKLVEKELIGAENGAALAAPQVGISRRFLAIKDGNKKIRMVFNPKIIKAYGEKVWPMIERPENNRLHQGSDESKENFLEGCLSFPGIFGTVKRFLEIEVEWQELIEDKFITKRDKLIGFEAIVWQHESDHLDGILLIDHFKKEGGKVYKLMGEEMSDWDVEKI